MVAISLSWLAEGPKVMVAPSTWLLGNRMLLGHQVAE